MNYRMIAVTCSKNQYQKNRICCNRCPAGQHVQKDCTDTNQTICATCKEGLYTATANNLYNCPVCTVCSSDNNLMQLKNCTVKENTVCGCKLGFYCSNDNCDHCQRVNDCPVGEGVSETATRTKDTVCVKCLNGTYSNVKDSFSHCKPHMRCEDFGRVLKTPGTSEMDTVCGDFLHNNCPWMLPAGLWAGLVLTVLILFAVVIGRKAKRRSYRAGSSRRAVTLVEMIPAAPVKPPDLTLPVTSLDLSSPDIEMNGHCQESCAMDDFKLPLFNQDENLVSCSMDSSLPITPLKVSVSFAETNYVNKGAGYCPGNFLRTHSEPQEDEWCGT